MIWQELVIDYIHLREHIHSGIDLQLSSHKECGVRACLSVQVSLGGRAQILRLIAGFQTPQNLRKSSSEDNTITSRTILIAKVFESKIRLYTINIRRAALPQISLSVSRSKVSHRLPPIKQLQKHQLELREHSEHCITRTLNRDTDQHDFTSNTGPGSITAGSFICIVPDRSVMLERIDEPS